MVSQQTFACDGGLLQFQAPLNMIEPMQATSPSETRIGLNQVKDQLRQPRARLKGRQASDQARAEVRALIGAALKKEGRLHLETY